MIFGPLLILAVLFLRGGLSGCRRRSRAARRWLSRSSRSRGLRKRFGGLAVTDDVSLDVAHGEIHAVIGPNGAGKTTLIHQISGMLRPDAGQRPASTGGTSRALSLHRRARLGLARSLPDHLRRCRASRRWRMSRSRCRRAAGSLLPLLPPGRRARRALNGPAMAALDQVGLAGRAARPGRARCRHGEKRQLELAIALATQPRLLLLDEPLAGAGPEETERLIGILRGLKRRYAILLVEHDMQAVFALADRISVLVYGRVIATGTPEAIRAQRRGPRRLSRRGRGAA